jgi:hypothetical protein
MNCTRWKQQELRYKRTLVNFRRDQPVTNYFRISRDFVLRYLLCKVQIYGQQAEG